MNHSVEKNKEKAKKASLLIKGIPKVEDSVDILRANGYIATINGVDIDLWFKPKEKTTITYNEQKKKWQYKK